MGPPAGDSEAAAVAWDAYWGFDCVAQRGMCNAIYSHLQIVDSSWQALKMLPSVSTQKCLCYHDGSSGWEQRHGAIVYPAVFCLGLLHSQHSCSLLQLT